MLNMTNQLRQRVYVLELVETENELGEIGHDFKKTKRIFANIVPTNSSVGSVNAEQTTVTSTYKFKIRFKSLPNINDNMRFEHDSHIYEVNYWNRDFKNNEYLEVFTTRKVQV